MIARGARAALAMTALTLTAAASLAGCGGGSTPSARHARHSASASPSPSDSSSLLLHGKAKPTYQTVGDKVAPLDCSQHDPSAALGGHATALQPQGNCGWKAGDETVVLGTVGAADVGTADEFVSAAAGATLVHVAGWSLARTSTSSAKGLTETVLVDVTTGGTALICGFQASAAHTDGLQRFCDETRAALVSSK